MAPGQEVTPLGTGGDRRWHRWGQGEAAKAGTGETREIGNCRGIVGNLSGNYWEFIRELSGIYPGIYSGIVREIGNCRGIDSGIVGNLSGNYWEFIRELSGIYPGIYSGIVREIGNCRGIYSGIVGNYSGIVGNLSGNLSGNLFGNCSENRELSGDLFGNCREFIRELSGNLFGNCREFIREFIRELFGKSGIIGGFIRELSGIYPGNRELSGNLFLTFFGDYSGNSGIIREFFGSYS
ncbi:uncharacterized protein LOC111942683 [Cyanistes caeruleus]|uniref:uncharacterized protein LOC111942683 n=1 Tax=Cyanistes caeruleus TaxID=156563 RepID=UPI000CDB21D1|nr:uncharacterized protein LOC111942683 [Cyanistes caeruleus]